MISFLWYVLFFWHESDFILIVNSRLFWSFYCYCRFCASIFEFWVQSWAVTNNYKLYISCYVVDKTRCFIPYFKSTSSPSRDNIDKIDNNAHVATLVIPMKATHNALNMSAEWSTPVLLRSLALVQNVAEYFLKCIFYESSLLNSGIGEYGEYTGLI